MELKWKRYVELVETAAHYSVIRDTILNEDYTDINELKEIIRMFDEKDEERRKENK